MWKSRSASSSQPIALSLFVAASMLGSALAWAEPPAVAVDSAATAPPAVAPAPPQTLADSTAIPPPAPSPSVAPPPAVQLRRESDAEGEPKAVNPRKALLLSFLLPGTGELYSGHKGRATGFFVSEGLVWVHYAAWQIAGHLRKDDYIEQAQLNAGIGTGSGSDDYWRLVGAYSSSSGTGPDSYEESLRRDARNEFPDDPAAQDAWVAERLPTGNRAWSWTSASLQDQYRETRQNATRAFNRAKFSFALAILNRIASAIDTQILHRRDAKAQHSAIDSDEPRLLTVVTADGGKLLIRYRF